MSKRKTISILGVTGSIGQSTADVVAHNPDLFEVDVITAHQNADGLIQAAKRLNPRRVVIGDEALEEKVRSALQGVDVLSGEAALEHAIAPGTDICMAAISGIAGLRPLMKALQNSKTVAIANKEPLVAAGQLVLETAKKYDCTLLPVDSEHNAVFQVFDQGQRENIRRIILTASGGPFLNASSEEMEKATPEQAIAHPNWNMGAKISVDSATMMNKALEVIEAAVLFDMTPDQIDVVIHPQSIVHSMVEYNDGSILSQMGASDMRTPIANVLNYPQRLDSPGERLDFDTLQSLEFRRVSTEQFPAIDLAYEALRKGAMACLALNAANEVAVDAFLNHEIGFMDIVECVRYGMQNAPDLSLETLEDIENADKAVREVVSGYLNTLEFHSKNHKESA